MVKKPKIHAVSLEIGQRWRASADFLFQEKSDGRWHLLEWQGVMLNAEAMLDGSMVINDIVSARPLAERWRELGRMASGFPPRWRLCGIGSGGEYLEHVIASGGEGVVAKPMATGYGIGWLKCKRLVPYWGIVADLNPAKGSARVELLAPSFDCSKIASDFLTGEDGGWVALGARFEAVKIGTVIKLEAYGQHPGGKLRESRVELIL